MSAKHRIAARIAPAVVSVAVWALAFTGVAGAETVTVGSPLTSPFFSTLTCGAPKCTWANTGLGEPGAHVTSPISGTIVRWRIAGNSTGAVTLRVLRPAGGGQFRGAGSTAPMSANGTTTRVFPADLPIQTGDLVGIDYEEGRHLATATATDSAYSEWVPALAEGAMAAPAIGNPLEILFNADVQPPPGIAALGVTQGSISGGTSVVISGHDFSGASAVRFGTVPASSFRVDSDSQITAVSPPAGAPGAVDVSATTAAGTTTTSPADQFTYTACVIPKLKGKKVKAARKKLRAANCRLGKVRGHKSKTARIRKQSPKPGAVLPPEAKVNVKVSTAA
jgi:hypothetical protein